MPQYVSTGRTTYKRKKYFKGKKRYSVNNKSWSRSKKAITTTSSVQGLISSDTTTVKLKYVNDGLVFSNSGPQIKNFGGNNLYTPDLSRLTGSQPNGYDQWVALYNKSVVLGSKISVTFINHQTDTAYIDEPIEVGVYPYYNAGDYTTTIGAFPDMSYVKCNSYAKISTLGGLNSTTQQVTIKSYMSTAKIAGKRDIITEENFSGKMSVDSSTYGDPPLCWFWGIVCYCPGQVGIAQNIQLGISITYYVLLMDRKTLAKS